MKRILGIALGLLIQGSLSVRAQEVKLGNVAEPAPLPNILFILADDLGYGDVGCYNRESKIPTPHLDRLALEGMRFTDAHSPSTVCTPTRYSLLTGQMAFRINYRNVFSGIGGPCLIKNNQLTLPQMLRDRGYFTAMTGKWHIGLSFLDQDGKLITKPDLDVAPLRIFFMLISMVIVFPFHLPSCLIKRSFPSMLTRWIIV
jgi:hypothetical protein